MNLRALFGHALMISLVFATTAVAGQHGKDASRLAPGLETSQGLKDNSNPGKRRVHLGPRPFWLVEEMDEGALKNTLQSCHAGKIRPTDFSIGHRGAPLQFPEHTRESYIAAVRMGAGILECDVAFNPRATTPEEYLEGTAGWRTDLYGNRGTLMTHRESIELFKTLGVKFTPELKTPVVEMPFEGDYSQQDYARQIVPSE